jgi:putative tricarboxylic transport membrane protein
VLAVVGVYSVRSSMTDVYMMVGFGLLGYVFGKFGVPSAPLLMAFVLGPMAENAVRQSLVLSDNDPLIFVERPISATIIGAAVLVGLILIVTGKRRRSVQTTQVLDAESVPMVEAKGE